jgi:phospholipid/cholesterol/gamma-HCH transport system substrate-binding protein
MILAAAVLWLSSEHAKSYSKYLIFMKEPVSGLTEKAAVKFNGVQVGYVDEISIDPDDPQEVRLLVKIDQKTPVNKSTTATLMSQGITGITYVGLKAKTSTAPPIQIHPGQPYPVIPSEPSLLVQLNEALRDVTEGLKGMGTSFKGINENFSKLFTPENLSSIRNILDQTSQASNQFPEVMTKIRGAATGLTNASEQVKTTLQNSEGSIRNFDTALKNLTDQTLPEIYSAAHSLKQTMDNVKGATSQIKQNPSVIIRGSQPRPPGPGE